MQGRIRSAYGRILVLLLVFLGTNGYGAALTPQCLASWIQSGHINDPFAVVLVTPEGATTRGEAPNAYLVTNDGMVEIRPEHRAIVELLLGRRPTDQHQIDLALNEAHGQTGNSFYDKSRGQYFVPDVHGMVLPMAQPTFNHLVQSTGPVMRNLRRILQAFYSHENPTPEQLGIAHWPAADQRELLAILRGSIYHEPQLMHPSMHDYPFLFAAGFDAALDSPTNPRPMFFEFNLGTPSGLSNNIQLLEALRTRDPALFRVLMGHMERDRTFSILREKLEASALARTGNREGISVIVGPGDWNAAHPDVSYISHFTGLPLVRPNDLYQDAAGNIRLNTGRGTNDPVVTGIYNRMEESYLMNNPDAGIPIRNPFFIKINEKLSRDLGIALEPHIGYDYIFNAEGEVIGINRDEQGRPKLQRVWDRLGTDPNRPDAAAGSLMAAVHGRRLFVSNLGGRTVDNKHVFTLIARNTPATATAPVAQPPRTLRLEEYPEFYNSTDLAKYVVKIPDSSSAEGVYILANLPPERRREIVEMVRANPTRFLVQERVSPIVILTPQHAAGAGSGGEPNPSGAATGGMVLGTRVNDLRIFVFMGPDGEVDAGGNSVLFRVASQGTGASNTGQGGGYGLFVPQTTDPQRRNPHASVLPRPARNNALPVSSRPRVTAFLHSLRDLILDTAPGRTPVLTAQAAETEALKMRAVMDLFGRDVIPFMHDVREFAAGRLSQADFHARLLEYRRLILEDRSYTDEGVGPLATAVFAPPSTTAPATPVLVPAGGH